jgi:hypothetical protein
MRHLALCLSFLGAAFIAMAAPLHAQSADSEFADYAAYEAYVDRHIMQRDFIPLIQRLGGRDEYTPEELAATQRNMLGIWQADFRNKAVFNRKDLGGGMWQEARVYWTGTSYAFFYALMHEREDKFVVVNFLLNSSSKPIMDRF